MPSVPTRPPDVTADVLFAMFIAPLECPIQISE
jgi:hypothetical protein